ncbi:hypothetical protein [Microcoleus sp.]|uniref:hypothetical protein n=1 Tax=Microcoleus sp. TaxID=44472 RepID=UPI003523E847
MNYLLVRNYRSKLKEEEPPPAPPKGGRKKSPPWAEGRSRHPSFLVKNPVAGLSLTNCWIIFINLTITLIGQSTGN